MKVFDAEHIRNVALVGHLGGGKTTLVEAILFDAGVTNRIGSINQGTTVSDYHPSEIDRQMSIFASMMHVEWNGTKINILDAPGYPDFLGEVATALKAADLAIFVINAVEGIEVGTGIAWELVSKMGLPAMFVVNHLDKGDANFDQMVEQLRVEFGRGVTLLQLPGGSGSRSIIDVLVSKQLTYPEGKKEPTVTDIDGGFADRAEFLHNELVESVAENDEALMDLYFEKGTLSEEEMSVGLRAAIVNGDIYPVLVTSATENIGVTRLLDFLAGVAPSPLDVPPLAATEGQVKTERAEATSALVFRTMAEQHVGEYSFLRVASGELKSGVDLENAQTGGVERLNQLFAINGHERTSVPAIVAGDLGAVVKLRNTHTNNTLRPKGSGVLLEGIDYPAPRYQMAVRAVNMGEEDRLAQGLHQLIEEDPSLHVTHDPSLNQVLMSGQGETHLEIARYRLKTRFHVEVEFLKPRIAYRETVTTVGHSSYRHKKQTGGAGQFADISLYVEPLKGEFSPPSNISVRNTHELITDWGSKVEYIDSIVGGVIDMRRFFGAIQKGVKDVLQVGPVAGYPVGDVRVVIYDGGMHPVDSNDNAFKTAAFMCFRKAFDEAHPVLLEPIHELVVTVPENYMGDVLGDLNTRRARIQGMNADGRLQKIMAHVPEAELYRYSTALRSFTQGRGLHTSAFHAYEAVPRHIQDKIITDSAKEEEG